jgi:hypothetical protein
MSEYCPMPKPNKDASIVKNLSALQITSVLSRMFERIMAWRIITYMFNMKYLKSWNIAYQVNKSIFDFIMIFTEDMYENFYNNDLMYAIFFDLSKAFDTVWINGLLYKLKHFYNFNGKLYNWLISFLKKRINRVVYNNCYTKWTLHDLGLPQGGPLSAILFIIYINDIELLTKFIQQIIYADDNTIWSKFNNNNNNIKIENILQNECDNFIEYCNTWKLIINFDKCESMILNRSNKTKNINTNTFYIHCFRSCFHHHHHLNQIQYEHYCCCYYCI